MQLPLRAYRVRPRGVDDRTRSRAVVVSITIFEIGWILESPICRARLGVQTLDDFFVAQSMKEHEPFSRDCRRRVACALRELPDQRRRQGSTQPRFCRYGVVGGPEKGGPVMRDGAG